MEKTHVKSAGGIFLGPIPIFGFASDKRLFYFMFILGIVLFVLGIIFNMITFK